MKTLLVLGYSRPTQQALWEETALLNVDLHVAYTLDVPKDGGVAPPTFGTAHRFDSVRIKGDRLTWIFGRGLAEICRRVSPDVVHILNEPWALISSQVLSANCGRVVTHGWENTWDQGKPAEAALRRAIARRNLRRMGGFAASNEAAAAWARRHGLPTSKPCLVVSAELPRLDRFERPERRRGEGRSLLGLQDEFVIGYVGRLVPEKGIQWLLDAWRAAALPTHARLVFIGSGPLEAIVRSAAIADPRVRLFGAVPFEIVPSVMAALDTLVLPSITTASWSEQFGRVLTEAMASSVPIIASDSGAIPGVVGEAGVLVKERDIEGLAASLRTLIADRATREHLMRAAGARAAAAFSPAIQAVRVRHFWDDVSARAGGPVQP